jgi:hypothetical protein
VPYSHLFATPLSFPNKRMLLFRWFLYLTHDCSAVSLRVFLIPVLTDTIVKIGVTSERHLSFPIRNNSADSVTSTAVDTRNVSLASITYLSKSGYVGFFVPTAIPVANPTPSIMRLVHGLVKSNE